MLLEPGKSITKVRLGHIDRVAHLVLGLTVSIDARLQNPPSVVDEIVAGLNEAFKLVESSLVAQHRYEEVGSGLESQGLSFNDLLADLIT